VIARLLGLCLLLLAAWPASGEVRAHDSGLSRLMARAAAALDLGEREPSLPPPAALAAGRADADDPEPDAAAGARVEPAWLRAGAHGALLARAHAARRHRACAAPPTGPPAA
jgi:hypothetical protein